MIEIIKHNVSIEKVSLYQYLAKLLGFNRVTDKIECKMDDALKMLGNSIEINDNNISMRNIEE